MSIDGILLKAFSEGHMFYFASFLLFVSLGLVGHGIYLSFFTSRRIRGRSMVNFGCISMVVFSTIAVIFQP